MRSSVRISVWYHVEGQIALYVGRRSPCDDHAQPCPCGWTRVLSGYLRFGADDDPQVFASDDPHSPEWIRSLGRFAPGVLVEAVRLAECPECPLCGKPMAGEGDICRAARDSEES